MYQTQIFVKDCATVSAFHHHIEPSQEVDKHVHNGSPGFAVACVYTSSNGTQCLPARLPSSPHEEENLAPGAKKATKKHPRTREATPELASISAKWNTSGEFIAPSITETISV